MRALCACCLMLLWAGEGAWLAWSATAGALPTIPPGIGVLVLLVVTGCWAIVENPETPR